MSSGGSRLAGDQKSETYGTTLPFGKIASTLSWLGGNSGAAACRDTFKCWSSRLRACRVERIPVSSKAGRHFLEHQNLRAASHKHCIHSATPSSPSGFSRAANNLAKHDLYGEKAKTSKGCNKNVSFAGVTASHSPNSSATAATSGCM